MSIPAQARSVTQTGPAHAVGNRPGFGPTPRSRRSYTARPDGRVLMALRATAYVLTSLASLAFLTLVVLGVVWFARLQELLPVR